MKRLLFCASGFALLALITMQMEKSNAPPGQQAALTQQTADMQPAAPQVTAALQNEATLMIEARQRAASADSAQVQLQRGSAHATLIASRNGVIIFSQKTAPALYMLA